jgi:hypothetical protein
MPNEMVDAQRDMSALMAAVLQKDWDGFILMVEGLTESEAKNVTVATMGFLGQAIRDFANHADMEPLDFWLEAMAGNHPEDPSG